MLGKVKANCTELINNYAINVWREKIINGVISMIRESNIIIHIVMGLNLVSINPVIIVVIIALN